MNVTEEEFKKLWKINSEYTSDEENFSNTFSYLSGILKMGFTTYDGKSVDFNLVYDRYKLYHHIKTMANEGIEEKFRKKENKVPTIFEFLKEKLFLSEVKIPTSNMHFYFFDTLSESEVVKHYNNFKHLCKKEK